MKRISTLALVALSACSPSIGSVVPITPVERKMIGLLQKFDRWDDDGNGQLDRQELAEGLAGSGHSPEAVMEFYDANRDGKTSLKEAQNAYSRAPEADARIKARAAGKQ